MKSLSFLLTLFFCTCLVSVNAQTTTGCAKTKAEVTACKKAVAISASTASLTEKTACSPKEAACKPCPIECCVTTASTGSNSVDKLLQAVQVLQVNQAKSTAKTSSCQPLKCAPAECKPKADSKTALAAKI